MYQVYCYVILESFYDQYFKIIKFFISLRLKPEDLKDNTLSKLRFVKFQNVQSITVSFWNKTDKFLHYLKKI